MLCACSKKLFAVLQCCILFSVSGNCNHLVSIIISCVAVMVILFIYLLLRGPATPWGDVSQALIYHQVGSEVQVSLVCVHLNIRSLGPRSSRAPTRKRVWWLDGFPGLTGYVNCVQLHNNHVLKRCSLIPMHALFINITALEPVGILEAVWSHMICQIPAF